MYCVSHIYKNGVGAVVGRSPAVDDDMFASRSSKPKPKRRRVDDDDDAATAGANGASKTETERGTDGGDDSVVEPIAAPGDARRKVNTFSTGVVKKAKTVVQDRMIASEREIVPHKYAGDATYESQIDTEKDRDTRAILERNIQINQDGTADEQSGKVYRGQAAYKNYIAKKESQVGMNKYTGYVVDHRLCFDGSWGSTDCYFTSTQGPIRAQTWARSICRFDYQPDVCKDYKETGFCGYGDSCIFLHDRSNYKSGWQIEKEWAEKERKRQQRLAEGRDPDADDADDDQNGSKNDDKEQFACTICRGPFRNAVETVCGHFFCEQCALKNFKKSSRCFNCRKQTNGVFNAAEKLRRRERELGEEEERQQTAQSDKEETEKAAPTPRQSEISTTESSTGWSVVE
ncbi:TPA: hypothetical protein N0F65_009962 [Lagenidium giganteum]|uniref:Uncharacterized protein n=1 Tax=Lagenidium giganteum TaxID=4803 RepID=A0AAV2YVP6_9STRA|nr:TPA: hypothetical protein N0F65_009962 [Lagenidium giganteum]